MLCRLYWQRDKNIYVCCFRQRHPFRSQHLWAKPKSCGLAGMPKRNGVQHPETWGLSKRGRDCKVSTGSLASLKPELRSESERLHGKSQQPPAAGCKGAVGHLAGRNRLLPTTIDQYKLELGKRIDDRRPCLSVNKRRRCRSASRPRRRRFTSCARTKTQ